MTFRKSILLLISLIMIAGLVACSPSSKPLTTITATAGTPQSAVVGTAYANLQVTVMAGSNPVSGATVTFSAPLSGASGTFATTGTSTETDTTDSSGVATSSVFTANTVAGSADVGGTVPGATSSASFILTNLAGPPASLAATSGTPQSAVISTAFASPLVATVTDSFGNPDSGVAITFTAPASAPSGTFASNGTNTETDMTDANGNATSSTFTADATAGPAYQVTAGAAPALELTPVDFALTNTTSVSTGPLGTGSYVFSLNGENANGSYHVAGAFTVGTAGAITSGEQDFVDPVNGDLYDQINPTGSGVAITADGNLQITLVTCSGATCSSTDTLVGVGGIETLNGTVLPLSATGKTFINEFDASASASGDINAQTTAATTPLASGYAFVVGGEDIDGDPLAIGGVINVDSSGGISGTGSILDVNDAGNLAPGATLGASTVTATPDAFGRVAFTLNPAELDTIILYGYIVDSNHIRLVEGNGDTFGGTTGGVALSQGANTGTFSSASVSGNTYVIGLTGVDAIAGAFQAVGQITPGATTVTGFVDYNDLSLVETASPDPVTAPAYTVDPTGDVTIAGLTDGAEGGANVNLQIYLDGNGNALAITLDTTDVLGGRGYLQTGAGSFTAASFSGPYALGAGGADATNEFEFDAVGLFSADGVGTFAGFVDINWFGLTAADATVTGTFVTTGTAASNGIFSGGTITGLDVTSCTTFGGAGCTADVFNYYLIDATGDNIAIETDANQLTLGYFAQQ
ncbi:MAG: hypothetical protein ABSA80_08085 [Terriglobales bacterium]